MRRRSNRRSGRGSHLLSCGQVNKVQAAPLMNADLPCCGATNPLRWHAPIIVALHAVLPLPIIDPPPTTTTNPHRHYQGLLGELESDLRRMMLPNTAAALRESRRNTLKDFLAVAGPLGVSHFLILTATEKSSYLRVAKTPRVGWVGVNGVGVTQVGVAVAVAAGGLCVACSPKCRVRQLHSQQLPCLSDFLNFLTLFHTLTLHLTLRTTHYTAQGPTLTLRIKGYSLMSDVASSQSRPRVPPNAFKSPPLVVLNNFGAQHKQLALAANLFQGMFPSINVHNVNLTTCQVRSWLCVVGIGEKAALAGCLTTRSALAVPFLATS